MFILTPLEQHFLQVHGVTNEQLERFRTLCRLQHTDYGEFLRANDYFLHLGKPGTGKTNQYLRLLSETEAEREERDRALEIAWLAGLYEGEGCLVFKRDKRNGNESWMLSLATKDRDVVEHAQEVGDAGGVDFIKRKNPNWASLYRWRVSRREDLARVLSLIYPYLGERRQARVEVFHAWHHLYKNGR